MALLLALLAACNDDGGLVVHGAGRDVGIPSDGAVHPDLAPPVDLRTMPDLSGTRCGDAGVVDILTDWTHCGGCGIRCCGQLCIDGTCWCDGVGLTSCRGANGCYAACVNLSTDAANCGACLHACAPGQVCQSGVCR